MTPFAAELIGTAILLLLGTGVVANVGLKHTTGANSGWIVITIGWAMAVFTGVFITASASGAHLNPAVTLALALTGKFDWSQVPVYWAAQLIGAIIGAGLTWLTYKKHYDATEDAGAIKGTFCTAAAISHRWYNLVTEAIGTFLLVFGVLLIAAPDSSLGALDALPVALLVLAIGLSLGGPTGYAINPVRDLGPRIVHAILPIPHKGSSDWGYSWIPVLGPMAGSAAAAGVFNLLIQ